MAVPVHQVQPLNSPLGIPSYLLGSRALLNSSSSSNNPARVLPSVQPALRSAPSTGRNKALSLMSIDSTAPSGLSRSGSSRSIRRWRPATPTSTQAHEIMFPKISANKRVPPRFIPVVSQSAILSILLSFLPWVDFITLCQSCSSLRNIFRDARLKDVILSRYVDGYGICLRNADPRLKSGMRDIPITLHDLDLMLISMTTPLHIYPAHALSIISSLLPSAVQYSAAQKLVKLTSAHSRFVLLLQNLAHCSTQPSPPEPEPDFVQPSISIGDIDSKSYTSRSRSTPLAFNKSVHNGMSVRELSFPAPLSSGEAPNVPAHRNSESQLHPLRKRASSVARHKASLSLASSASSGYTDYSAEPSHGQRSTLSSSTSIARKARLSLFGGAHIPPPPPKDPHDLKNHSESWRRTLNASMHTVTPSKRASRAMSASEVWHSDDDSPFATQLRPDFETLDENPNRYQGLKTSSTNTTVSSSESSFGSASSAASGAPSGSRGDPSPTPSTLSKSPLSRSSWAPQHAVPSSPHDLFMATSRVRSPILRVFLPCSRLTEGDIATAGTIPQCEEQLVESGLWEHMSTGDIVCNLGFVPPSSGTSSRSSEVLDESDDIVNPLRRGRSQFPKHSQEPIRTWLIFNGEILIPFCPTFDQIPVADSLTLPSPWYYDHIMPASFPVNHGPTRPELAEPGKHLKMILHRLPPPPSGMHEVPQMALINYSTLVRSPHCSGGYASVRKWVWTAHVWRGSTNADTEIGIGWEGEWILEGEGTREGRQELLDIIRGQGPSAIGRQWEFVRERSGGGKIWLRLLNPLRHPSILSRPSSLQSSRSDVTQTLNSR